MADFYNDDLVNHRLARTERILNNLAERLDLIFAQHDWEIKALLKWQAATQRNIDDLARMSSGLSAASQAEGERVAAVLSAVERLQLNQNEQY